MGKTATQQSLYEELQAAKEVQQKYGGSVEKMIAVQKELLGSDWANAAMELLGITAEAVDAVSNHHKLA